MLYLQTIRFRRAAYYMNIVSLTHHSCNVHICSSSEIMLDQICRLVYDRLEDPPVYIYIYIIPINRFDQALIIFTACIIPKSHIAPKT